MMMPDHPEPRPQIRIAAADPDDPAALACLAAYYRVLVDKITGVTPDMLTLPDPGAASYRAPDGAFLIAWADDRPIGCVSLRPLEPGVAEVKRLWVDPSARGQGLARRLMRAIESRARDLGFTLLKLDSNRGLPEAIALYLADGWTETAAYTGFPANIWLAKSLARDLLRD